MEINPIFRATNSSIALEFYSRLFKAHVAFYCFIQFALYHLEADACYTNNRPWLAFCGDNQALTAFLNRHVTSGLRFLILLSALI